MKKKLVRTSFDAFERLPPGAALYARSTDFEKTGRLRRVQILQKRGRFALCIYQTQGGAVRECFFPSELYQIENTEEEPGWTMF